MAATIHDVAKRAGVNSSTVSRVLNQKATVTEETKQKIYAAMRELDYHYNSAARNLANGSSNTIGVVINAENADAFSNIFFSRSLFAIEKEAQANGFNVIIANSETKSKGMGLSIERLILERKVDGLILPPAVVKPALLEKIRDFPCVILGQPNVGRKSFCWVDVNNEQGASMAVEHLLSKGYQRIAYLGGENQSGFVKNRFKGYSSALKTEPLLFHTDGTSEHAQEIATNILKEPNAPDAFLCNDNFTAYGLLKAAKSLSISIPDDLGIVTFDNYPIAAYTDPPLTSVDVDTALLGDQSAKLLFQLIHHHTNNQQIMLCTTLMKRASTDRG